MVVSDNKDFNEASLTSKYQLYEEKWNEPRR